MFLNRKPQAEWLSARLTAAGFPAAYLSGGDRPQEERMQAMVDVRAFKLRVRGWDRESSRRQINFIRQMRAYTSSYPPR